MNIHQTLKFWLKKITQRKLSYFLCKLLNLIYPHIFKDIFIWKIKAVNWKSINNYFFSSHLEQAPFMQPWFPFPLDLILQTCVEPSHFTELPCRCEFPPKCWQVQQHFWLTGVEFIFKSLLSILIFRYSKNFFQFIL